VVANEQTDREFLEETARYLASDQAGLAEALPRVYDELRRLASRYLEMESAGHTLQPTALVHEAYLQLRDQHSVDWQNRAHFLGVAAHMMRRILVRHARARNAGRRRGQSVHMSIDEALDVYDGAALSAIEVNRALDELQAVDSRQAQIAELRFFGGLTIPETAEALGISPATVKREWNFARLWLEREIGRNN
jgi:RNA polymerase sigma factor (TIGR02999 family)